jgi:hypothetical protein
MWMQLVRMEPVGGSAGASPSAVLWLFLLFYLLGDIAGIMLLSLGNSAPYVLSSVMDVPGTGAAGARRGRGGRGSSSVAVRWPRRCASMRSGVLAEVPRRRRGRRLRGEGRRGPDPRRRCVWLSRALMVDVAVEADVARRRTDGWTPYAPVPIRTAATRCMLPAGRTCSYSVLL